jgi:hypothetical protein
VVNSAVDLVKYGDPSSTKLAGLPPQGIRCSAGIGSADETARERIKRNKSSAKKYHKETTASKIEMITTIILFFLFIWI